MLLTIKIINLYNINNSKFIYISPLGWTPSAGLLRGPPRGGGPDYIYIFIKFYFHIIYLY